MSKIAIQLPLIDFDSIAEIEVKVNGKKRRFNYRIETLQWEEVTDSPEDRIEKLRQMIEEYDKEWQLVQIGAPVGNEIPIMFRQVH